VDVWTAFINSFFNLLNALRSRCLNGMRSGTRLYVKSVNGLAIMNEKWLI